MFELPRALAPLLVFGLIGVLVQLWIVYWIIRLAVRHGVRDAVGKPWYDGNKGVSFGPGSGPAG